MRAAPLEPADGELIVEARLVRPPQDMLEAAVVLEAWAGVPAQSALVAARQLMPQASRSPQPSVGTLPAAQRASGRLVPGAPFIVTVIAIACWAAPLAASLGGGVVERGLMLALPLTLALQWVRQSRYLNHPQGWRSSPAGAGGSCWVRLPSWPPRLGSSASPACSPAC